MDDEQRADLDAGDEPLCDRYDLIALDLDGVVYIGPEAVPGAAEELTRLHDEGHRLAFVTNNAARTPAEVAEHLRRLGVPAEEHDVVNSAQAAARLLAENLEPGSSVYLIGGRGLEVALAEEGLITVTTPDQQPVAVVQGYGPEMPWKQVVAGAVLVRQGLPWVATNTDSTIPTPAGIGPGNGTLVRLVADFAGREPEVAGKPSTPLLKETLRRVGGERPIMVGDRLDTDILGARNVGWDSLLVMTGVTGLEELASCPHEIRPTYLSADLSGLSEPVSSALVSGDALEFGGWQAGVTEGRLWVAGSGSASDWWRCVAVALWQELDTKGSPADYSGVTAPVARWGRQVRS